MVFRSVAKLITFGWLVLLCKLRAFAGMAETLATRASTIVDFIVKIEGRRDNFYHTSPKLTITAPDAIT